MIVRVNLDGSYSSVELVDVNNFKDFHLEVVGDDSRERLADALRETNAGHLDADGGDAYITIGSLILMAEGQGEEDWMDQFEKMVEYAKSKGWVDVTERALQAHVEWPAAPIT